MALPKLEGIITIPSGTSVSVTETGGGGTASVSLTAGDYSLSELCAHLASALTSNGTLSGTYSCSVADGSDTSTGKVTISATGITSFTLTWTSTVVRDALGFDATLTPTASSFTADDASPWIWLPNVGPSDAAFGDGDEGTPVRTVAVNVAPSGDTYAWASASLRYENVLEFTALRGNKVAREWEVVANESLQSFFETVISKGIEFRYYADRADDDEYVGYVAKQGSAERLDTRAIMKGWRGVNSAWTWRCEVYSTGRVSASDEWTPADLSPLLWLRSDLGITITGSGVSTWADQSGNGNNATQATDSRRPTYSASQINGQPALAWVEGSQTQLDLAGITIPTACSVIVVGKLTSGKTSYRTLLQSTTSEPDVYYQNDSSAGPSLYWDGAMRNTGSTAVNDGVWRAIRWMWTQNTTLYLAYNNGADTTASGVGRNVAGNWNQLGTASDTFHLFDGSIAEVIVVPSVLTAGEITSLNAYLSARYAIW